MPRKKKEEELNSADEAIAGLQALKVNPAYKAYLKQVEIWRDQALGDILVKKDADKEKGEYSAYQRCLKIPDVLINNLRPNEGNETNFDPYTSSDSVPQ